MTGFLLIYDSGCFNGVFRLPAAVLVVFREGLSLQEGKIIGESEGNDTKFSDNSESRKKS